MVGYCTHGNKASNSIKFGGIVDQRRNYLGLRDTYPCSRFNDTVQRNINKIIQAQKYKNVLHF